MKTAQRKNPDIFALFLPEIRSLLAAKDFTGLKQVLKNIRSVDIAYGWRHLESQDKIFIFKLFSAKRAVEVFESLNLSEQEYILNNLENADVSQIINEMAPDERADLFKDLPQKVSKKLFKFVNKTEEQNLRQLLNYEEGTAGSLMTTDLVEIKKDMSARQAIISLQENLRSDFNENVYSVFVTDENHKLLGSISLQDLIKAPPDILIKDVMVSVELVKIDPNTPQEEVSTTFKKYDLFDAPIVNKDNLLVGIITVDDIIETIEKRSTRDLYEIGKMDARGGEIISYATATMFDLVKRRAGWLILLLVFDFLTGTVLKSFQNVLSSVVALAFFIPMLLDTGGNAGAQASITIIRGLATGDVNFKNVLKVIKFEFAAALLMGVIVGIVAFARALLLQKDFFIAGVVGISMLFIAILAIATGIFLPLASKKVGLDPAVLAGPITTSIVDVVGLIIYFKIAQLFIPALQY